MGEGRSELTALLAPLFLLRKKKNSASPAARRAMTPTLAPTAMAVTFFRATLVPPVVDDPLDEEAVAEETVAVESVGVIGGGIGGVVEVQPCCNAKAGHN